VSILDSTGIHVLASSHILQYLKNFNLSCLFLGLKMKLPKQHWV